MSEPATLTPDQIAALQTELDDLQRKLAKRQDQPGFAANAEAIKARIAEIQAQIDAAQGQTQ